MGMYIEDLREMLCEELDKIAQKGELTAGSLETVDKLTHSIKSIDTIMAMEESGYSQAGGGSYEGSYARGGQGRGGGSSRARGGSYEGSYARGGGGRSGAQRRDSMGRYSRRGGYSRGDGKEEMLEKLENVIQEIQQMDE